MLTAYNVKIPIYCKDEAEARQVQDAVKSIGSGINIIASDLIDFNSFFKRNEKDIVPVISDVFYSFRKGIGSGIASITKNAYNLYKMR